MKNLSIVATMLATFILIGWAINTATARADQQQLPQYQTQAVQKIEHLSMRLDMTRGVRLVPGATKDAGPYLSGEPDAATGWPFDGPDAAVWRPGADAAIWIPPDASAMGARPYPSTDLNYVCTSMDNASCLRERGAYPDTCRGSFVIPADQMTQPFMWSPNADGGAPAIRGSTAAGTAYLECYPWIPVTNRGR